MPEKLSAKTQQRMEKAIKINSWLASRYHSKFSNIPRDEFLSAGLIGIAQAHNEFKTGNWSGYVKVAIQNEMLGVCRHQKRKSKLIQKAYRIYNHFHYILCEEPKTFIIASNTRPRDPKTGWFITEKANRKLLREIYEHAKRKNGHNGSKQDD